MRIGILCEAQDDADTIKALIARILQDEAIIFNVYHANGPIEGKLDASTFRFFEYDAVCDIAVFLTDQDKDAKKAKRIRKWVQNHISAHPTRIIVVGFPNPTLEQWLITDEDFIKSLFGLDGSASLPFSDIKHPKPRLKNIVLKYDKDITRTVSDVYCEIALGASLKSMCSDPEFNTFKNQLSQLAKTTVVSKGRNPNSL